MIKLNYGIIACGVLGAIGMLVLPLAEVAGIKVMLLDAGGHGYLVLACMLAGAGMGAINAFKAPARWAGGVALVAFLIAGMKLSGGEGASGQTVGMLTAFLGMLLALGVTVKPGTKG